MKLEDVRTMAEEAIETIDGFSDAQRGVTGHDKDCRDLARACLAMLPVVERASWQADMHESYYSNGTKFYRHHIDDWNDAVKATEQAVRAMRAEMNAL